MMAGSIVAFLLGAIMGCSFGFLVAAVFNLEKKNDSF